MQKNVNGDFAGLEHALQLNESNGGIVRLMFVHGMGDPQPAYSNYLTDKLAKELSLMPQNDTIVTNFIEKDGFRYGTTFNKCRSLTSINCYVFRVALKRDAEGVCTS